MVIQARGRRQVIHIVSSSHTPSPDEMVIQARGRRQVIHIVCISVVDPSTLYLDPDPDFCSNLDLNL